MKVPQGCSYSVVTSNQMINIIIRLQISSICDILPVIGVPISLFLQLPKTMSITDWKKLILTVTGG